MSAISVCPIAPLGAPAGVPSNVPQHRGLQAAETEVEIAFQFGRVPVGMRQARRRERDGAVVAVLRQPIDRRPARDTRGRAAWPPCRTPRPPHRRGCGSGADTSRGARRDTGWCGRPRRPGRPTAAAARRSGARATRCGRRDDGRRPAAGRPRRGGLRERHADQQRSDEAGPLRDRDGAEVAPGRSPPRPARARRRRQMSRMCWREASSGTTPPHSRWIATCEATTFERIAQGFAASPVSSTTAADVSSQEVSMPRMRIRRWIPTKTRRRRLQCRFVLSCVFVANARRRLLLERALQRLGVRRPEDASLGDDAGDEAVRRHVERGVPDLSRPAGATCEPPTCVTSRALRSSIGMWSPSGVRRSIVESGAAT